jgi:hypothetical protein
MTLVWRPGFMFDADASTYIEAVEAADEAASPGIGALETNTRYAINNFVIGCKQDGIWGAIKASCILAGARTRIGALTPLAGATGPDSYGFVDGDYDRKTGLKGNRSTKYLDTRRAGNADPQNNAHAAAYATSADTGAGAIYIGTRAGVNGATNFGKNTVSEVFFRSQSSTAAIVASPGVGFIGVSRSQSASYEYRLDKKLGSALAASQTPDSNNFAVFAFSNPVAFTDARLSFYSIGEALDLAALDGRVTDLMTAIGAAIP